MIVLAQHSNARISKRARCSSGSSEKPLKHARPQDNVVAWECRWHTTPNRTGNAKRSSARGARVIPQSAGNAQAAGSSKEDPRRLVLLIQKAPNWRALKQLHYERVCISHPLLSATVLCKLPALVLPLHPLLTNADIRELQGFVAFLVSEVDNSVVKKATNTRLPVEERTKLSGLLVKCLYALSLLDLPDCPRPEWIPRLCAAVLDCSDTLGAAEVASCVRAISQLQGLNTSNGDVRDLAELGLRALQLEVTSLGLQHTSWLLRGLAGLKQSIPARLLAPALQHASLQAEAVKQDISNNNVDSRWGHEEEQVTMMLQSLSDLCAALVQLKQRPSSQSIAALCHGTGALLQRSSAGAASDLLHSLVRLGHVPSAAWMQQYFDATEGHLSSLKGHLLARQAEAVVHVAEEPSIRWLSKLSATVSARAELLRLSDLAACCSCLHHFEFQPLPAQLGNIIAALPDADIIDTEQLVFVMEVYSCCGVRPKQAAAEKLEAATKQLLGSLTLDQFSRLIITLKRPGWSSAQQLLDSFMPRSHTLMKTAAPSQVVGYLQALRAADYLCWDKTQLLPFVNRLYQVVNDLSPSQCLDVFKGVTSIQLWPYTEIIPATAADPRPRRQQQASSYTGAVRAIPTGAAVVEPVPWLTAIIDKIRQTSDDLPPERCGSLLTSLRTLASSQHVEKVKRASKSLAPVVEKFLDGRMLSMRNTSDVCGLYLSLTLLDHNPSHGFTQQWADAVLKQASSVTPSDAVMVLQGVACMPQSTQATLGGVVDQVLRAAVAKVDSGPDEVVEVLSLAAAAPASRSLSWATDTALLDFVMQRLKLRWNKMSPEVLAKAIKMFATIRCPVPAAVIQLHANAMYPKAPKASVSDLMDVVWSYKQLSFPLKSSQKDKLLATLAEAPSKLLQGCRAAPLIATMQELHQRGLGELSSWMGALEASLVRDLSDLQVEDVGAAMVLMDLDGHSPSTATAAGMAAALDQLRIPHNVQHCSLAEDAVRIFAAWGRHIGQRPWLQCLCEHQASTLLPTATPTQVVGWLWQYERVRFNPPDEWLASAIATVWPHVQQIDGADLVRLTEGLYSLGSLNRLATVQKHLLLDGIWQAFTASCKEVASKEDVQLFCKMLHWMGLAGYEPDSEGRDWINTRLKQQKKLIPFYSMQQVVWLLGSLSPLGNTNTFMAQELRSAFMSHMTNADSHPELSGELSAGIAACTSAPGPLPAKLVQSLRDLVEDDRQDAYCLPELVWCLMTVKGTLDSSRLEHICKKISTVVSTLDARRRFLLVAGLAELAGPSLWSPQVCGAAATGRLLDSLCSEALLHPPLLAPSEVVIWLRNLFQLGYTPGSKFLDAVMDYLTLIDPLARQTDYSLGVTPSPHIASLHPHEKQSLLDVMSSFGYDVQSALDRLGSSQQRDVPIWGNGNSAGSHQQQVLVQNGSQAAPQAQTVPAKDGNKRDKTSIKTSDMQPTMQQAVIGGRSPRARKQKQKQPAVNRQVQPSRKNSNGDAVGARSGGTGALSRDVGRRVASGKKQGGVKNANQDLIAPSVEIEQQGKAKAQPALTRLWTVLSSIPAMVTNEGEGKRPNQGVD